jgi:hypothetical protein
MSDERPKPADRDRNRGGCRRADAIDANDSALLEVAAAFHGPR